MQANPGKPVVKNRRRGVRLRLPLDPVESARVSGLRYVSDTDPGIFRKQSGNGFRYLDAKGETVADEAVLKRIQALAIPPAWTNVWICKSDLGHLQAVGRDAKGRKQYRYHALYRHVRNETKFSRMSAFGEMLPEIRKKVADDLAARGLPKNKVLAAIIRLLDSTAIRIGNPEYARDNGSFGLTTLQNDHAEIGSQTIRLHFKGKSGQLQEVTHTDPKVAAVVRKCQNLPGQELFLYVNEEGEPVPVRSEDVNSYLRELTGEDFSAKDFRTWRGTTEAFSALEKLGPAENESHAKKNVVEAVKSAASKLGNRPSTCRAYYIHPAITEAYLNGTFFERIAKPPASGKTGLSREEQYVLALIQEAEKAPAAETKSSH